MSYSNSNTHHCRPNATRSKASVDCSNRQKSESEDGRASDERIEKKKKGRRFIKIETRVEDACTYVAEVHMSWGELEQMIT